MIPEILVFSKKSWDGLSKDDQALVVKLPRKRSRSSASSGTSWRKNR